MLAALALHGYDHRASASSTTCPARFAAYLQSIGLKPKDRSGGVDDAERSAISSSPLPAFMRSGMVVVNTNPLYTPEELRHQLVRFRCQGDRGTGKHGDGPFRLA